MTTVQQIPMDPYFQDMDFYEQPKCLDDKIYLIWRKSEKSIISLIYVLFLHAVSSILNNQT